MRAENAPEQELTEIVGEGTGAGLSAGAPWCPPPLWHPAGHQNATSMGCAGFVTGMWLQLMVWPCHSDHPASDKNSWWPESIMSTLKDHNAYWKSKWISKRSAQRSSERQFKNKPNHCERNNCPGIEKRVIYSWNRKKSYI